MRKEQFIKKLTVITISVLIGIITLQVYWLVTSYRLQKSRFKADIQNALSTANVKTTLRKALLVKNNELLNAVDLKSWVESIESSNSILMKSQQDAAGDKVITLPISDSYLKITDTLKLLNYLKKVLSTNRAHSLISEKVQLELNNTDLELYKAAYKKELISRDIFIPFELAVVNSAGSIHWSSADSGTFRRIAFKSAVEEFSQANNAPVYGLQAAFPDANLYLLHKMIWILSVSVFLIVIGTCSLGYLLVFFFNQKKLSDIRNDFMNNMTHELKTPISAVSIALEMVLDDKRQIGLEKKKSYLQAAQKELKRLEALTENILKILSVEKTEIKIIKSSIPTVPWLRGIVDNLSPLSEDRSARIDMTHVPETVEIFADRIHMTNVMYNIIENAIKYNNKKEPEIQISVAREPDHVTIQVSDNGEGIPSQYLKNIFDKFFRVPKGDSHNVKGYGLGLSYVKGIVDMHGGSIHVWSIPDKGSTFTIQLPLQ
jgi:signal transduction histidine kinase